MNKKLLFVLTGITLLLMMLLGWVIQDCFINSRGNVVSDADFLFKEALWQDHNRRLKKEKHFYYSHPITHDWPKEKIVMRTEQGERVQTNIDSIRALPEKEKTRLLGETGLLKNYPIIPDTLNSCFQEILHQRNIFISSKIRYVDVENEKTEYSGTDTTFLTSAYPLTEYKTGIFDEIIVQAYVKVPVITVIEKAGMRLFIPLVLWLLLLAVYIRYMYKVIKKRQAETRLSEVDRIRQLLQLNAENSCLQYKDQKIKLPPTLAQLVLLFLSKPNFLLTKDEIGNELWESLDV